MQQAEQATDAADSHISVGKIEMISRAVSKMTNSAAAGELTSVEIWTLAKTAIKVFGVKVRKQIHKLQHWLKFSH